LKEDDGTMMMSVGSSSSLETTCLSSASLGPSSRPASTASATAAATSSSSPAATTGYEPLP
jgi:hypothetical protein